MLNANFEHEQLFLGRLQDIINHGFENAAKGLSGMIGTNLSFTQPKVQAIHFQDIPMSLGGPENDAVGIYLRMEGGFKRTNHVDFSIP